MPGSENLMNVSFFGRTDKSETLIQTAANNDVRDSLFRLTATNTSRQDYLFSERNIREGSPLLEQSIEAAYMTMHGHKSKHQRNRSQPFQIRSQNGGLSKKTPLSMKYINDVLNEGGPILK